MTPSPAFVSGRVRARRATLLLVATILLSLVAIALDYTHIDLLTRAMGRSAALTDANVLDRWRQALWLAQLAALLATATVFLLWVHRVRANLPALGAQGLKFSPRWAVAGFLVPVLNLIVPARVLEEIWRASDPGVPGGRGWQAARASRLIEWWWGIFLLSQFLDNFTARIALRGGQMASDLLLLSWIALVSELLTVVAAGLAILIVRGVESRQKEKRRQLEPPLVASSAPAELFEVGSR